jgi:hypothetical protein
MQRDTALAEAQEFLRDRLSPGPVSARDGEADAHALGIARRTLIRARKKLGVVAEKSGLKGGWTWRLPAGEECQVAPKSAKKNSWHSSVPVGTLREDAPPTAPGVSAAAPSNKAPPSPWADLDIPENLRRRRCDHCGVLERSADPLKWWPWQGRPDGIWLHPRCEEGWHDSEGGYRRALVDTRDRHESNEQSEHSAG